MDPFAVWRHRTDQTYPYRDPSPGVLRTVARVLWRRFGPEITILLAVLAWLLIILPVSGCAGDPNRAAMVWGAAMQSAARPADPPAFTHYMTPGDGMTTCHHLGGGVAHCF